MLTLAITASVVLVLSFIFATLADTGTWNRFALIVLVSIALLGAFIGIGAVFGKTLGDFLRNVND